MNRELDTVRNDGRNGRNRDSDALITTDDRDDQAVVPAPWARAGTWNGFFTFRYSSTEIYSQGGDIHVKTTQTRYQDGKLTSEECEGTLDRRAAERMAGEVQGYFLNQLGSFMKLLYAPFSSRSRRWYDE